MSDLPRLSRIDDVGSAVAKPTYAPDAHGSGIIHIGMGAFHRAHQAVYTDDALSAEGGDWRIIGVSLRSTDIADALNGQRGLYTLIERGTDEPSARLIGSIKHVIAESRTPGATLAALAAPQTRIVSLTVTEKAYGIDRASGSVLEDHPAIVADLACPRAPSGTIGLLTEGLRLRKETGLTPFTILCCDNLPENGTLIRAGVLDFAARVDPALRDWIAAEVAFPSTMVDRITPSPTPETLAESTRLAGVHDLAAVETESFSQWVIEDRFTAGRPAWEAGGALFVDDVAPYERMKLRMLNGAHSLIAYAGFLSRHRYVRDVMGKPMLAKLVHCHIEAAARTLKPLPGIDLAVYGRVLTDRFANPAIAHETYQIAMDGTEKLPQRIFAPAIDAIEMGQDIGSFAFATAAWMRYCLGRTETGDPYALRDPQEIQIAKLLQSTDRRAENVSTALHNLPGLFPERLRLDEQWKSRVTAALSDIIEKGIAHAVMQEVEKRT